MKRYRIKEVFATLQGEGALSGSAAVFLRFTGCNAWSGLAPHRERDLGRTGASCAMWCDTDFVGGETLALDAVVERVLAVGDAHPTRPQLVVCTGGEPLLQLDAPLIAALRSQGLRVAVETNGSVAAPDVDWLCVSPKWLDTRWVQTGGDELKLVVPAYNPDAVWDFFPVFNHYFVQPQDGCLGSTEQALQVVRRDPRWRLSMQTHKLLGLR